MAKDYQKGSKYRLYLNTGTYASPTWAFVRAAHNIAFAPNPDDVVVEEQDGPTGHLRGEQDPQITFTLNEDKGDSNVETIIAALYAADTMLEFAVARGDISVAGTKYLRMESCVMGDGSADRASVGQYDVTARRHANSDYGLQRATAS